jgi:hypothetical protein
MSASTIAGLVGSFLTFASVLIGAWLNLRSTKGVHSLVNQQHQDLVVRNTSLVKALTDADVKLPNPQEGTTNPQ